MQDWTMIPLHIRCTQRYKIDPNYPEDDARWWNMQEKIRGTQFGPGALHSGNSECQIELLEFIRENGEVDQKAIKERFGYRSERTKHIINGLSVSHPICEETVNGFSVYSVLSSTQG